MKNFDDFVLVNECLSLYKRELQSYNLNDDADDEILSEVKYKKKPKEVSTTQVVVQTKPKPIEKAIPEYTGTEFSEFSMPKDKSRDFEFAIPVWEYYTGKEPVVGKRVNMLKVGKWNFDHSIHALAHYYLRYKPILSLNEYKQFLGKIEQWLNENITSTDQTLTKNPDEYPEKRMERVIFVKRVEGKSFGIGIICENFNREKVLRIITYLPKNKFRDKDGLPHMVVENVEGEIQPQVVIIDM